MSLRILVAATLAVGVAFVPTAADAKGAREMTVAGPGLDAPIRLANTANAAISPNTIAQQSGLFSSSPDRVIAGRPHGRLGPRYVASYQWLVGPDKTTVLRQQLYPFADGGAFSYTRPGRRVLDVPRRGGWYRAGAELTLLLVAAGVPVPAACQPSKACATGPPGRSGRGPSRG
jgi:hypothetical protein